MQHDPQGLSQSRILVTGATGFIGARTVAHLQQLGHDVVATTRDGRGGTSKLDMREPEAMPAALAGIDAIVHCAVGDRAVTVDGTRHLLRAAAAVGVRRLVHLSTMSVYGAAVGTVTEDTPMVAATGDGYAAWKVAAEQACMEQTDLQTVRLRPTIVYGPGGTWWLGEMVRRVRSGRWGTFGAAGEGTCNPVHVDDVAGAIAAALAAPRAAGEAFNVNGPETTSWNGWFSQLAALTGARPLRRISPAALRTRTYAALPLKALAKLRPGLGRDWLLGVPGRGELGLYTLRATYPTAKAAALMGWRPGVSITNGLADSLPWLRSLGLVDAAGGAAMHAEEGSHLAATSEAGGRAA